MTNAQRAHHAIALADVESAARRIGGRVVRTPIVRSERLSRRVGADVALKAECLQHIGAFKARGALNAVLSLTDAQRATGVVTHSSGNHAAALARAAQLCGAPCWIVMPRNSASNKVANVRSQGVEPVLCGPSAEERVAAAERVQRDTGAEMIHPYNDPRVMSGQGTIGLEIVEQAPEVNTVVVPVGGGGLLSGVLVAVKAIRPDIRVVAAEPEWADDAARSLRSGSIQQPTRYDTVADGLRTPLGTLTFPIISALVDDLVLVSEEQIVEAADWIAADAKLVSEPSGAVGVAAVAARREELAGQSIVAIVTGGNADA